MGDRDEVERLRDQLRREGEAIFDGKVRDLRTIAAIMVTASGTIQALSARLEEAEAQNAALVEGAAKLVDQLRWKWKFGTEWTADKVADRIRALVRPEEVDALARVRKEERERAVEKLEEHFPGTLYASNRTRCAAAIGGDDT